MKKLSYIILGFIIGAILTYLFCPRQDGDIHALDTKIVKPKGVISVEEAEELNNNWTKFRKAAVDSAAKKQGRNQDDRSVYWDLKDVKEYLAYAEHYSDSIGYKMTGIQVYLGVYGKNAGQSKKDLTTMFMAPTGRMKSDSKGSMMPFKTKLRVNGNPRVPALNRGSGGGGGYPQ
ncbi:hypothetical protein [Flavisericum labens]|uniref:hypothetical protein n=1 Tax=Flavisericum labens TaxID=3377112 RepID=UPI00387B042B